MNSGGDSLPTKKFVELRTDDVETKAGERGSFHGKSGPKRGGVDYCRKRLGSRERTKDVHVLRRVPLQFTQNTVVDQKGVLRNVTSDS